MVPIVVKSRRDCEKRGFPPGCRKEIPTEGRRRALLAPFAEGLDPLIANKEDFLVAVIKRGVALQVSTRNFKEGVKRGRGGGEY